MSAKINIYVTDKYTNIDMKNATELDVVLAIGGLFDMLTSDTKKLLIPKLENIKNLEQNEMSNIDNNTKTNK